MIHGVVARSAAAMPPASPVQRKAILRSVITVRAILPMRPVVAVLRLLLRLSAGDERGQAVDVGLVFRTRMLLRPRLKLLLMLLRLIVLLVVVLLARIVWLRLAWGERLAADMGLLAIALVVAVIGSAHLAGLLLLIIGLTLPELLLRCSDDTEIVLGVLIVIFRCNRIPGALRVTGKLKILFGDMGRRTANFYVRPARFVHSRQWILMMVSTFAVATAHAFVLTVSHGLLFRQPPFTATARLPPILFEFTRFHRAAARRSKFRNLNLRSLTNPNSVPNVTRSMVALHRQTLPRARIACRPNP
jgi:hypothetical protein